MDTFGLVDPPDARPTWNAAPTQELPVVRAMSDGRKLNNLRWGLVPPWSKDLAIGSRMINARSETAAEKPSFREALRCRRCLIVADGFYEWQRDGDHKRPFCIHLRDRRPFGMGGLWETWSDENEQAVETFTILTTSPNSLLSPIHDRMPVIIPADQHDRWLAHDLQDPGQVACLMVPYPDDEMEAYEVTSRVNSPRNNDEACLMPANE